MDYSEQERLQRLQTLAAKQSDEIDRLKNQLVWEIEKRKELEAAINAREERYQVAFDLMHEYAFSFVVSEDGQIRPEWRTTSFERITGYSNDEVNSEEGWLRYTHPEDYHDAMAHLKNDVLSGKTISIDFRIIKKNGEVCWLRTVYHPVWDDQQQSIVRFYGVGRDITEEKAIKDQQARFITNAMHELSHPVSSILMRLYLMRRQPERLDNHLDALEPVANHIRHLIEDMREISYLERGLVSLQPQPVAIQQVLRDVYRGQQEHAERKEVTLKLSMPDDPLMIMADVERLYNALVHLVGNSIETAVQAGVIQIKMEPTPIEVPSNARVEITYQGRTGHYDQPSLIFHPFYRPSEGNMSQTGLELSIVREVSRLHGGTVNATSDVAGNRTFTLTLPLMSNP